MTNQNHTHIAVIADCSGSMAHIAEDMNGGLKTFLDTQAGLPGDLTIDITTFESTVDLAQQDVAVDDIDWPIIVPQGMTALYDAIGITVTSLGARLAAIAENDRPGKVLVVVVTDGAENSSKEYAADQVRAMVEHQQDEYDWGFIFLGANIDAFSVGGGLGFRADATMNYAPSAAGTASMTRSLSNVTGAYRGGEAISFTDEDRKDALGG